MRRQHLDEQTFQYFITIGATIDEEMIAQKLSVARLARLAGVSRSTVYEVINGTFNVRIGTLKQLTDVLGITIDIKRRTYV